MAGRDFETAVLEVLGKLKPGDVVTYGEVAAEAGFPGAARAVGNLLKRTAEPVPWWRVITAGGRLSPQGSAEQRRRLETEGVVFNASGRVARRRQQGDETWPTASAN